MGSRCWKDLNGHGCDVVAITPFPNGEKTDMTACSRDISETEDERLCTVKEAAALVGISAQTLMKYRKQGLVCPMQNGRIRRFSAKDIKWLRCLRELIHVNKISIEALKKLLGYAPCWEIKNCPRENCNYNNYNLTEHIEDFRGRG